jgi:hypothetical protein
MLFHLYLGLPHRHFPSVFMFKMLLRFSLHVFLKHVHTILFHYLLL